VAKKNPQAGNSGAGILQPNSKDLLTNFGLKGKVPSLGEIDRKWSQLSGRYLSAAFRHPDQIQQTSITPKMISWDFADVGSVILTAQPENLPDAVADAGLAQKLVELPEGAPLTARELGQALRAAYAEHQLAQAIESRDPAAISEALLLAQSSQRPRKLRVCNIAEFLKMGIPPREFVLEPIIPSQGLVQLFAERGLGKTFLALNIAIAVASGGGCLRWRAPQPRRVVYIDGEMPAATMQERLALLCAGTDTGIPDPSFLKLLTPDLQADPMPDLSTRNGQLQIEPYIQDADLVILDNLSTLCRTGKENESESWLVIQEWLLRLRQRRQSVLIVHHAGKSGQQRGTSRREDILDTVIQLKKPADHKAEDGARFEVHLTKARGICGQDAEPFEGQILPGPGGSLQWLTRTIADAELDRVRPLLAEGLSIRDIAEETGLSRSKVHRLKKKLEATT
jgi:hypothetical protein